MGLSPRQLTDLLAASTPQVLKFWSGLDLSQLGEPVSWAGPQPAPMWLDCARDFTEYWAHQRQLREATGRPQPRDRTVDHVALDTFLRAVPHTLRDTHAAPGTVLAFVVTGPSGGWWHWRYDGHGWLWTHEPLDRVAATATLDEDTTWRLCTREIEPAEAGEQATLTGDRVLARALLQIVSIIR